VVFGWAARHATQEVTTTVVCGSVTPARRIGPESALPVKVSMAEPLRRSNISLLDRDSRPDVRNSGAKPGTLSVK
jgi:hypothetical protein